MICIVDYGVGNLFSLKSSLAFLGKNAEVTSDPVRLKKAQRIILPGVGAFGDAIQKLSGANRFGANLKSAVMECAKGGTPLLGVCLGMQMLFERSFEYGEHGGLGLLKGEVRPLSESARGLKIPHMGWNSLSFPVKNDLFKYVSEGEFVYFVHSYHAVDCADSVIATCFYGGDITAASAKDNVFGTQFHPEKSGDTGLRILKAFCEV